MSDALSLIDAIKRTNDIELELCQSGGEISAELDERLTEINLDFAASIDATAMMLSRLDMSAEYWKLKAQESAKVAAGLAKAHERLKFHVKQIMQLSEKKELVGLEHRYVLSRAKPRLIIDETVLPAELLKEKITLVPDKSKIEAKLELGEEVAGARLELSFSLRSYPAKGGPK